MEAMAWANIGGGGGFPFYWAASASALLLRVFTILSCKGLPLAQHLALNNNPNLSNVKGDNLKVKHD
jgi:hypothetical protein